MQELGDISLLCAFLISAYNAPSPPTYREKKKGRGKGLLITGKNDLSLGHQHRVMTPDQKKWKEVVKAFYVTIVYETVKEEGYKIRNLNHMRNMLQLYHSLLPLQSWRFIVTSYCPVFRDIMIYSVWESQEIITKGQASEINEEHA